MAQPNSSFGLDFLRRLLCAHSIAQRRCGGGADINGDVRAAAAEEEATRRSPCIVARLMGLDAMPAVPALRRSRSASSAEGWPSPPCCGNDDDDAPRRTASFREKTAYLRRENDEFLLLSFSPEDDDDDGSKTTRSSLLASRSNDEDNGGRRRRRRRPQRRRYGVYEDEESRDDRRGTPAEECGLQNSSPVSVLEARDGQDSSSSIEEAETGSTSPVEIQQAPKKQQQDSGRKLIQPELDNLDDRLPHAASSTRRLSRFADKERRNRRRVNQDNGGITFPDIAAFWQPVCRLLEEDLNGGVKWEGMGDATNIAAGLESEILDQLIREATDELVQLMQI